MDMMLMRLFMLFSRLPMRILYALSDVTYALMRLVGYRRKVVTGNLSSAFPEKSRAELLAIERGFYHFLCDYFFETLKLLTMSDDEVRSHLEIRNMEEVEKCFSEGQSCAAILGHYGNWEYLSAVSVGLRTYKDAVMGLIYHPLRNAFFDRLFLEIRQAHGGTCIPKKDILRYLFRYKQENRKSLFGYISDQAPKWSNIHFWLPFLNHNTPVFTGGERIMRKMNDAVFYVDMQRPRRGHYICTFELLTRTPNELPEYEITRCFFTKLEETVRRDPRYYLWSHNRWKRTYEEYLVRNNQNKDEDDNPHKS